MSIEKMNETISGITRASDIVSASIGAVDDTITATLNVVNSIRGIATIETPANIFNSEVTHRPAARQRAACTP